jgi:ribosome-associated protein
MDNRELALFIADFLDGRKADDIAIIDIAEKSGFADYFVICTAGSIRQLQAMSADLEDKVAEKGTLVHHVEGKGESGWILMDFGDIIVNLFTSEQRDHYNIDKIWGDCVKLDFEPKKEK